METLEGFVSSLFGCNEDDLYGHSRKANISSARKLCMCAMRDFTERSLTDIGGYFNRDHVTALHLIRKAKDHYKNEPTFRALADVVYDKCRELELTLPFRYVPDFPSDVLTEEELILMQLS